ncbi:MAG: hypothetical protein EXS37_15950 [Opitutus sp.]|nr:hypothetical protein [Opitutus sp.]
MKKNPIAFLRAAALAAGWTVTQIAFGQTAPAPPPAAGAATGDDAVQLDAVTVTGSNIRRIEIEKVLPVTVFNSAAIAVRDASQPSDLLTALPQVTGLPGNETATLGATARGDNASISLRGLNSGNTLILLNGRRLAPHPISQGEGPTGSPPTLAVNVNQLPTRGLERVDVLRDGASSVYGSDAVAGVVNYTTQRRFIGTELALRVGQTSYDDGQEWRATLTHGFAFAKRRGRVMFNADFYHRAAIYARDRSFSAEEDTSGRAPAPWNVATNTTFNARSATSAYGNYLIGTITAIDPFGGVSGFSGSRPAGVPATLAAASGLFVLEPNGSGGAAFGTATPGRTGVTHDYYWNNNAYRVIQPRSDRTNVFTHAEFDLTPRLTAFADASLYRAESVTYREPDGIAQSTDGLIVVPATNPYNPFGSRFWSLIGSPNADGSPRLTGTPGAVSITDKRLSDLGPRTAWVDDSVYRGVAGVRGKIFQTWSWETAALYSTARVIDHEEGAGRKSLLVAAINQTDPAKAFNPFSRTFAVQNGTLVATGPYRNPDSVTSTFRSSFIRNGITKLGSADFRASGDLLRIWGGNTVGGAFGGEFRYEAYDDFRPPFAGLNPADSDLDPSANDFLGVAPESDTHGNRHVSAFYAETVVPLVGREQKVPFLHSLDLATSARVERYSDFGGTTRPKYSVAWKPVASLMVRGSVNYGFHAPNLAQLFTGTLIRTATGSTDSYRSIVTGGIADGPSNRRSVASGNRELRPEKSTGKSAGIVYEVPRFAGLSLAIDYWEIRHKDVITSGGGIPDDTAALLAATQAALAAGQRIDQVLLDSGGPNYKGDPSVARLPDTQADRNLFAAYNARQTPGNQRAVVGGIDFLRTSYFNKSQQFLNGLDFDLNYVLPKFAAGDFTFGTTWTYLNDFHSYATAGAPRTELRRTNTNSTGSTVVGGATPVWRGATNLLWRRKQWTVGLGHYYIGRYTDVNATTTQAVWDGLGRPGYIQPVFNNGAYSYRYVVHDTNSYNAFATYRVPAQNRWLRTLSIRVGVNNLFNAQPPLSADSRGYEVSLYNVMARGRTYSLQITKRL